MIPAHLPSRLARFRAAGRAALPWLAAWAGLGAGPLPAAGPVFHRAINLNGPALVIDGRRWEAGDATNLTVRGGAFENQSVGLKPATDPARARMLRSSRWGSQVDVEVQGLGPGDYQVILYVWEDNHSEQFDLLLNGRTVLEKFHSGAAGSWRRLGPWPVAVADGRIRVGARGPGHGAANLSGLEIWAGTGPIPEPARPEFVASPTAAQAEFFERRIRPVLAEHCYECHSAGAKKLKAGLVLDSRAGVIRGGDTGPVITPGDPEASLLIQAVRHADPDLAMPPQVRLPDAVVADLEEWVRQGAPDPRTDSPAPATPARGTIDWTQARQWWSFRPVADPPLPPVDHPAWPLNGIDRFVLAGLAAQGLSPAPDAGRREWLRRVTYDLTGLPPTPAELEAFLADAAPAAHEAVVQRLLESPRYGERWGRHWLDVVRYADTAGDNSDFPIPQMFRYRNWVIGAFNRDLPYDAFVRQQLAGDLMPVDDPEETRRRVVATGYLANARRFGSRVDDYPRHLTIEDTLDNLGRTFLGLSISCARCHDHKFDPVTSADYYALYGIFHSTRYPWPGIELDQRQRDLVPLVAPARRAEAEAAIQEHQAEQRRREKAVQKLRDSLPGAPADRRRAVEEEIRQAGQALRDHLAAAPAYELAYAVAEAGAVADVPVQQRGDPARPGAVVPRRFLAVLGGTPLSPAEAAASSGRRQLAEWIVDPANPLTARVMINRLWHHHFGTGLVSTPNDFGRQGRPPTHPELLDWLATRFREAGWSVKAMHRLIVLSRTYRQSAGRSDPARERDPAHQWLAGFPTRRLDAEALRDTLLVLGGGLDGTPGGAHPFPPPAEWKFTQHNPFKAVYDTPRRSVYLMTQRIQRHPLLATFDGADPAASTPARLASTTPVQALFLLNDPLVHRESEGLAVRVLAAAPEDPGRLEAAWRLVLGRPPRPDEAARALDFLEQVSGRLGDAGAASGRRPVEAWGALMRVLFRLNEFLYLD